ncbi:MAG TPA: SRPBCC family protein [Hyphomicrobiaceae bacterium]|nr:SRPBCC family protein [Hyphomicrobiaceae bacterium]
MKKIVGISAAAVVLAPSLAFAETPLHAYQYVYIKAPPAKVWKMIEGFDGMQAWHPDVAEARIVEGAPGEAGTVREIIYKDGTTVRQELTRHDHTNMRIDYQTVGESRWGLKDYRAVMDVVELKPGQSALVWRSSFLKGDYLSEVDVVGNVQEGYEAGLDNIRQIAESG